MPRRGRCCQAVSAPAQSSQGAADRHPPEGFRVTAGETAGLPNVKPLGGGSVLQTEVNDMGVEPTTPRVLVLCSTIELAVLVDLMGLEPTTSRAMQVLYP